MAVLFRRHDRLCRKGQCIHRRPRPGGFIASGLNYDATLRNLELIGEAATHIPDAVRAANPQIPWRLVIATRNRLIHGYLGIDNDTLWSIIQGDIPALLPLLRTLRGTLS